jgi:squalene synthase HpnC
MKGGCEHGGVCADSPQRRPHRQIETGVVTATADARMAGEPAGGSADLPALSAVLAKAAQENFPVGPGFLPRALRRDLMAIYGYARFVDDIGDETTADTDERLAMLDLVDADVTRLFAGQPPTLPPLLALAEPVRAGRMPEEPLRRLVEANRLDQRTASYPSFDDLRHYCTLSADPVGRLVLSCVGAATPERVALSDQVCTGLQLVEHWQDVAEDHARGRVYLPQDDIRRFGVTDADLAAEHASPSLRALLAFEAARAARLLDAGLPLVASLSGAAKVAVAGFVAGGRAALHAITAVDFDVLPGAPKPTKKRTAREALAVLLARKAAP